MSENNENSITDEKNRKFTTKLYKGPWPIWLWVLLLVLGLIISIISITINPRMNDGTSAVHIFTLNLKYLIQNI